MDVEASIDTSVLFSGDTVGAKIVLRSKTTLHILSAGVFIQSTLHLGDLLHPEPFEPLRTRGLIAGSEIQKPRGLWGMLGLSKHLVDYKLWNSHQQILCADIQIAANETRECECQFELPPNLPPSHTSKPLEVHHELVIEFQYLEEGRPTQRMFMLPFKVYPQPGMEYNLLSQVTTLSRDSAKAKILDNLNTLLQRPKIEIGNDSLAEIDHAQNAAKLKFQLVNDGKQLAAVNLARAFIHAGDTLTGSVSLAPECFHMCAKLERVEKIKPEIAVANEMHRKVISSQSFTVYGLETATFQLATSANMFPQIDLTQVDVQYVLRMELVCTDEEAFDKGEAKAQLKTYTISTTIPINIAAPARPPVQYRKNWSIDLH